MTMSRAPVFPVEEKVRVVLSILAGELSVAEAARRAKVSEQSVGNCRFQFPTDCSETFARRAASATDNSPAKIDRTTRTFSSTGNTGALDMVIRLLQQVTTRNQRALPQSLTRDTFTLPGDLQITGTTLHVRLDPASAPRRSRALAALAAELTTTATRYPGTNLTIAYSVKGHDVA